jgi:GT2 family glycosyltransferase
LESLYKIIYPNYDVILVDNGSEDKSIERIKEYCNGKIKVESDFFEYNPDKTIRLFELNKEDFHNSKINIKTFSNLPSNKKLILIKNDKNYGFAEGTNIGIEYVLFNLNPNYILLLNNDTVVDKDFLTEMIMVAVTNDKIGFIGPKTYYYNFDGRKDVICFAGGSLNLLKGHSISIGFDEIDEGQYDKVKNVDYAEGSCLLIKKEVLEEVGLLNTRCFAYWEETDLCWRGYKYGYKSIYVPKAKIWHKISKSVDNNLKIYYYTKNRILFMRKYLKKSQFALFTIYFFIEFIYFTVIFLILKRTETLKYFFKGVKNGYNLH